VGYRGKLDLQDQARVLRASGETLADIASTLNVSKSSVSVWVRDVEFAPHARRPSVNRRPHAQHVAKLAEIAECDRLGRERLGRLSNDAFLAAGAALYAGEGSKTQAKVTFANTDASMIAFFCSWLRTRSSLSMSHGCGSGSTSTRAWIFPRLKDSGRR
jgi:hypothetical protein